MKTENPVKTGDMVFVKDKHSYHQYPVSGVKWEKRKIKKGEPPIEVEIDVLDSFTVNAAYSRDHCLPLTLRFADEGNSWHRGQPK